MKENYQTPLKQNQSRISESKKKSQKVAKNSLNEVLATALSGDASAGAELSDFSLSPVSETSVLNGAFPTVLEEVPGDFYPISDISESGFTGHIEQISEAASCDFSKDSSNFSPISEISDGGFNVRIAQTSVMVAAFDPDFSPSLERFPFSDASGNVALGRSGAHESDGPRIGTPDAADAVVNFLKQTGFQALNSADENHLLEKLVRCAVEEFYSSQPKERNPFAGRFWETGRTVLLCLLLLGSFAMSLMCFFGLELSNPLRGTPPT